MSKALNSIPNLEEENGKSENWFWKSTKARMAWAHLLEPSEEDTIMWACWATGCFSKLAIFNYTVGTFVYWPEGLRHRGWWQTMVHFAFPVLKNWLFSRVGSFSAKQKSQGPTMLRRICHCHISPLGRVRVNSTKQHILPVSQCVPWWAHSCSSSLLHFQGCFSAPKFLSLWVSGDSGY